MKTASKTIYVAFDNTEFETERECRSYERANVARRTDTDQKESDAAFIAAADPPTMLAALDEIERLRAENEKLREALKPFARLRRIFGGREPDNYPGMPDSHGYNVSWAMEDSGRCDLTLGQFRRARRALEGGEA